MSYVLVDEDGTELSSPETDPNSKPSASSSDNEYEEIFMEARDSPTSEFINVKYDDDKDQKKSGKSMPRAVTTTKSSGMTTSAGAQDDKTTEEGSSCSAAVGGGSPESEKVSESVNWNLFVAETSVSNSPEKKSPEKMIDDMLRMYNNFAISNISDSCFRDPSNCLDNFDEGLAAGYVATLTGNLEQLFENTLSDYIPFSTSVLETLERFDELVTTISCIPMEKFDNGLLNYSVAKYYQCIGDVFSARFASGDFNHDKREELCIYATACYIISLQYLKDAKFGSRKTWGVIYLSICEMKIAIEYSVNYYNIENEVLNLLKDIKIGQKIANILWVDIENKEKISKSFLALNRIDDNETFDYSYIPTFNFQTDFVSNLVPIWDILTVDGFLDHLLFIIGYGRVTDFIKWIFFDVFLTLVTFAIDYCRIPNYKFGYDYLFRNSLGLPPPEINFISPKVIDHSIIVSVARHGKCSQFASLFWKAVYIIGRELTPQSRKALIERHFKTEAAFREVLGNIVNEVNAKNRIHNFYVVSERFHLMLIWFIYHGFSDFEMNYVQPRLDNHLKYLETAIRREKITFTENDIDDAEAKGTLVSQLFPNRNLYWLVHPSTKTCEYLSVDSVKEVAAHYCIYINSLSFTDGQVYWEQLSEPYKKVLLEPNSPSDDGDIPEMSEILETEEVIPSPSIPTKVPEKPSDPLEVPEALPEIEIPQNNSEIIEEYRKLIAENEILIAKMENLNNENHQTEAEEQNKAFELEREAVMTERTAIYDKLNTSLDTALGAINLLIEAKLERNQAVQQLYETVLQSFSAHNVQPQHILWLTQHFGKQTLTTPPSPLGTNDAYTFLMKLAAMIRQSEIPYQSPQGQLFMQQYAEATRITNNFAGLSDYQNGLICANIAVSCGLISPDQKDIYTAHAMKQLQLMKGQTSTAVPTLKQPSGHRPLQPADSISMAPSIYQGQQRPLMHSPSLYPQQDAFMNPQMAPQIRSHARLTRPALPPNPFKINAPPRGFLTNSMVNQQNQDGKELSSSSSSSTSGHHANIPSFSTSENLIHKTPIAHTSIVLPTSSDLKHASPRLSTIQEGLATSQEATPKTTPTKAETKDLENVIGNDAFRQAFEHWRGINADTPEEVRQKVVAPSVTPQQIAIYKPMINHNANETNDDEILFPPRFGETISSKDDNKAQKDDNGLPDLSDDDDEEYEDESDEDEEEV